MPLLGGLEPYNWNEVLSPTHTFVVFLKKEKIEKGYNKRIIADIDGHYFSFFSITQAYSSIQFRDLNIMVGHKNVWMPSIFYMKKAWLQEEMVLPTLTWFEDSFY